MGVVLTPGKSSIHTYDLPIFKNVLRMKVGCMISIFLAIHMDSNILNGTKKYINNKEDQKPSINLMNVIKERYGRQQWVPTLSDPRTQNPLGSETIHLNMQPPQVFKSQ